MTARASLNRDILRLAVPALGALIAEPAFLMVDAAVLATAFLILGNFIADVLLFASDPRIRAEQK